MEFLKILWLQKWRDMCCAKQEMREIFTLPVSITAVMNKKVAKAFHGMLQLIRVSADVRHNSGKISAKVHDAVQWVVNGSV